MPVFIADICDIMGHLYHTFKNNGLIEYNDDVYDNLFEISNNDYVLLITPKVSKDFWRLGIRLSKTKEIEFYHPDHRYKEPDFNKFIDVQLSVGDWDGNATWTSPNKLELAQYNLKPPEDHILDRSENYNGEDVTLIIRYKKQIKSLHIKYEIGSKVIFENSYPLDSDYKYFKVFAWADKKEFEIDCIILDTRTNMAINLKNLGRISELTISEISKINYIVGENRSGKSALLAGIALLEEGTNYSEYPFKSYLSSKSNSEINVDIYSPKVIIINSLSLLSPFYKSGIDLNTINILPNEDLFIKEEMGRDDENELVSLGRYGFENSPKAKLSLQDARMSSASGNKALAYYKTQINKLKSLSDDLTIIIIDEPETHLNPKLHKDIHSLLEATVNESERLIFFVATHSSYLIAAAASSQSNSKVYCLDKGKLITNTGYWTDSSHKLSHLASESSGFKPSECKLLVHDILGATLSNYFPKIIYCENSLKDFINAFVDSNHHNYDRPLIIPSGNDINSAEKLKTVTAIIEGVRDHYRNNFNLLGPIAYAIIDKLNESQKKEKEMIEKVKKKNPNAVVVLDENEIEISYPNELVNNYLDSKGWSKWNRTISFSKYLESHGISEKDFGIHKSELAKNIGSKISLKEFQQKFSKIHTLLHAFNSSNA